MKRHGKSRSPEVPIAPYFANVLRSRFRWNEDSGSTTMIGTEASHARGSALVQCPTS